MSIHVERDGTISVIAPVKLTADEVNAVVESRLYQIYRQLAEWESLNTSRIDRQFVNGESFPYLGSLYRLEIVEDQDVPLKLYQGYFHLRKNDLHRANAAFAELYRVKGLPKVKERIALYARKLGVNPTEVRILDLKNRWASASKKGAINLHWKCIMAPVKILDYIIVHELCHFKEPTHNEAFWNLVDKLIPDYAERKNWLRTNGASMNL